MHVQWAPFCNIRMNRGCQDIETHKKKDTHYSFTMSTPGGTAVGGELDTVLGTFIVKEVIIVMWVL